MFRKKYLSVTDDATVDVFSGDAKELWKKKRPLDQSICDCKKNGKNCDVDDECVNRIMAYECDNSNCNIGADRCTNRPFAELQKRTKHGNKYDIGVEVWKTQDRGHGLRANRTFEPGQVIIEYTGEIITQDERDKRMNTDYKDAKVSLWCLMLIYTK